MQREGYTPLTCLQRRFAIRGTRRRSEGASPLPVSWYPRYFLTRRAAQSEDDGGDTQALGKRPSFYSAYSRSGESEASASFSPRHPSFALIAQAPTVRVFCGRNPLLAIPTVPSQPQSPLTLHKAPSAQPLHALETTLRSVSFKRLQAQRREEQRLQQAFEDKEHDPSGDQNPLNDEDHAPPEHRDTLATQARHSMFRMQPATAPCYRWTSGWWMSGPKIRKTTRRNCLLCWSVVCVKSAKSGEGNRVRTSRSGRSDDAVEYVDAPVCTIVFCFLPVSVSRLQPLVNALSALPRPSCDCHAVVSLSFRHCAFDCHEDGEEEPLSFLASSLLRSGIALGGLHFFHCTACPIGGISDVICAHADTLVSFACHGTFLGLMGIQAVASLLSRRMFVFSTSTSPILDWRHQK